MTLDPRKSPTIFSVLTAWCALVVFGSLDWMLATAGYADSGPRPSTLIGTLGRLVLDLGHAERPPGGWRPSSCFTDPR